MRDLALINAGAAIYAAGVAETLAEGVEAARAAIVDGRAERALSSVTWRRAGAQRAGGGRAMSAQTPTRAGAHPASTREELERRKRELPRAGARVSGVRDRRQAQARSARRFRERAEGARDRGDRGVQATLASAGTLREAPDLRELVGAYERGGASALSVLTEGPHFDGSLEDLRAARAACELPLLRKDFIVDEYQLYEAKVAGADAVLLIVAALGQEELSGAARARARARSGRAGRGARPRGVAPALELEAELIGINNRDLRDFSVDVERTVRADG